MQANDPEVEGIFEEIRRFRQTPYVPNLWRAMASNPTLLKASWERFRVLMGPGHLAPEVKEMLALAVAATNGCAYNIRVHTHMLTQRFGLSEAALAELRGVIDLFNGINAFAEAAEVEPDTSRPTGPT